MSATARHVEHYGMMAQAAKAERLERENAELWRVNALMVEILERAIADEKRAWTGDFRKAAHAALDDVLERFKVALKRLSLDGLTIKEASK